MNQYMPRYLKTKNRMLIFDLLRTHRVLSRAALVRMTGMSFPTVLKVIDKLLELGIVIELDELEAPAGAGRRGHLLRFNEQAFWAVGAQFEGQAAGIGLVDLSGTCRHCRPIQPSKGGTAKLSALDAGLRQLLELAASENLPILGIGLGFPAMVNPLDNTILHMSSLHITKATAFQTVFPDFLKDVPLPFFLDNDVNLACLGEAFLRRPDPAYRNLLYVTLGTGCGAGLLLNGELWYGCGHKSGEIGSLLLSPLPDKALTLEDCVSLKAIERRFHVNLKTSPAPEEPLRETLIDYLCPLVAHALANTALLLNIERCTVTGITPLALGAPFLQRLQAEVNSRLFHSSLLLCPSVSGDAGIVGAAAAVFEHRLKELLSE